MILLLQNADVNGCTTGTHGCHYSATCHNTQGSYTCSCNHGYTGDEFTCIGEVIYFSVIHMTLSVCIYCKSGNIHVANYVVNFPVRKIS